MTKKVYVKGTFDTPEINFDPNMGKFQISGRSLPANSVAFYEPVIKRVHEYLEEPEDQSLFEFKMDFISSSSTKIFQDLFLELYEKMQKGYEIQVNWYYRLGDDDMKELGDELRQDTDLHVDFIAFE
ncbi:MAG: DUF1987 domain-containing protein [Bacteroidales bacterium]|nr:DUF1987 domain-containing protein [Bacteroidales bacterium]